MLEICGDQPKAVIEVKQLWITIPLIHLLDCNAPYDPYMPIIMIIQGIKLINSIPVFGKTNNAVNLQ